MAEANPHEAALRALIIACEDLVWFYDKDQSYHLRNCVVEAHEPGYEQKNGRLPVGTYRCINFIEAWTPARKLVQQVCPHCGQELPMDEEGEHDGQS